MVSFSNWIQSLNESLDSSYDFRRDDLQGKPAYVFDQWVFEEDGVTYTVRFQNSEDFGKKVTQVRFGILSGRNLKMNIGRIKDIRKFTGTLFAIFEEALRNPTTRVANKNHGFLIVMPNKMFERIGERGIMILGRRAKRMKPVMTVHDQYFDFYPQPSKSAFFLWRGNKSFSDVFSMIPAVTDIPPASGDEEEQVDQQSAIEPSVSTGDTTGVEIPQDIAPKPEQPAAASEPEFTATAAEPEPDPEPEDPKDRDYSKGAEPIEDTEIMKKGLHAFIKLSLAEIRFGTSIGGREPFSDESMKITVEDFAIEKVFRNKHAQWIEDNVPGRAMVKLALLKEGWRFQGYNKSGFTGLLGELASEEAKEFVKQIDDESLEPLGNIKFEDAQRIVLNAESMAFNIGETYEIRKQKLKSFDVKRSLGLSKTLFGTKDLLEDFDDAENRERILRRLIASEPEENLNTLPIMEDPNTGYRTLSHKYESEGLKTAKDIAETSYYNDYEGKEKAEFLSSLPPAIQATVDGKRSENFEIFKTAFMDQWTMMHGSDAQKDANTVFTDFGANTQIGNFWGYDSERVDEIPEHVADHYETVYNQTQEFFRETVKNHEKKTVKLYRGIGLKNVEKYIPGALESWSKQKSTANKFAKMMAADPSEPGTVLMAKVPYTAIWGTWESLKPEFPPEDHLKGKREYIVMGGTFATTEIYVMNEAEDRVLPFVEWIKLKESENTDHRVQVIDQPDAETDEETATGLDPAEEGLDKLSRKGKDYRKQAQRQDKDE